MRYLQTVFFLLLFIAFSGCSLTKYVPEGSYLVNHVRVESDNKQIKPSQARPYLKQVPTHKTFGFIPFPLYLYNLSGTDSTKWINRFLRRSGNPPVLYDEQLTVRSEKELRKMMANKGFVKSDVTVNKHISKKKISVEYLLQTKEPLIVGSMNYHVPDDSLRVIVLSDSSSCLLKTGDLLDRSEMDNERVRLTRRIRNKGYWGFNKEYINFTADTLTGSNQVGLTLNVLPLREKLDDGTVSDISHQTYRIGKIYIYPDYDPIQAALNPYQEFDTVQYRNYTFLYEGIPFLKKEVMVENCFIKPGNLYSDRALEATYNAFARLQILKYVNIRFEVDKENSDLLNCFVLLTSGKNQTVQAELEGTNSAGDLGFAAALTYQHRNIFHGSETFTAKVRGGYENLTGDVSGLVRDNYNEFGIETGLSFPKFLFPMLSVDQKSRIRATTEFKASYNYQHRPEYTRVIAGGGWKYNWTSHTNRYHYSLDFIDVNYVYLPFRSDAFIDSIINKNPITYSSYKDHLITRTGFTFYSSNIRPGTKVPSLYTFRANTEIAGNFLYGISTLIGQKKVNNAYEIAGLRYEQYWKLDMDYAYTMNLTEKNSLAFHLAAGIGVPYGNSTVLPFEKRYYSGGANSVRGWSVRTLGPGRYHSDSPDLDYFNQCGDIRLDASMEYRTKLFWKLQLAAFVDAGNVWTIRDYDNQPGGLFQVNEFYKEIAASWGLGVRFDFSYFILRLDMGVKAYDPSKLDENPWVLKYPLKGENHTFHFAVGYPF